MGVYNGNMKGDAKREFTFTGRKKNMVIDYIFAKKGKKRR